MISVPVYVYSYKEEESTFETSVGMTVRELIGLLKSYTSYRAFDVMQFDCFICMCYQ